MVTVPIRSGPKKLLITLVLLPALLGACSSPDSEPPIDDAVVSEPLFILLDAYKGNEQFFIRYRRGGEIFYAAGDLKPRPYSADEDGNDYATPVVAPLDLQTGDPWVELTRNLTPVPILAVSDWIDIRTRIFSKIVPRKANQGIAVSFDRLDYFFFYDKLGNFRARRLIDKPPEYSVTAHVDLKQKLESWQPLIKEYLVEKGITSDDVIFSTGDLDKGSIPFLYADTRDRLIVLVQYNETPEVQVSGAPGGHVLQAVWHFIGSHSFTLVMRPFSSLKSLLSVVSDTALEAGRGLTTDLKFDGPIPTLNDGSTMDLHAWEQELDVRLNRPASLGTLEFLIGGEAFFPRLVDAITSAEASVDIRAYIFDTDDVALNVGELLKRRSREGLDVKILYDGLGTIAATGEQSETLPEGYRKPVSIESYLKQDSRVEARKASNPWLTGDHVKTMVIDRKLAFMGGMNIGREYRYDWHDLMMEVRGPVVDEINSEFDDAWGRAGLFGDFAKLMDFDPNEDNQHLQGYPVRLIYTKPGQFEIFALQREAIRRAQRYIYIENAYFTDDALLRELILARRRGVDVRVVIPLKTDSGMITRNIALAANVMLENGIRIYLYPGFSHAKAAVFDGWASVGSANLDRLSLRINNELNIATSEPEAVNALIEELFLPDFEKSTELTEPFPATWTDHIIELFGDFVF